MTKEKLKSIIFNPIVVLIQSIIPIVFIELSLLSIVIMPDNFSVIFNFLINSICIYPFIGVIWCVMNLVYCIKQNNNKTLAVMSLTIAVFIFLNALFFIYILYSISYLTI